MSRTDQFRSFATILASSFSGAAWGGIAYLLVPRGPGIGPSISAALLAAPFIGVVVGELARTFSRHGGLAKALFSLASLYGAVALFGLAIPFGVPRGLQSPEHFYESVVALWVGVSVTGLILILWPLALLNHHVLWWLDGQFARRKRTA